MNIYVWECIDAQELLNYESFKKVSSQSYQRFQGEKSQCYETLRVQILQCRVLSMYIKEVHSYKKFRVH